MLIFKCVFGILFYFYRPINFKCFFKLFKFPTNFGLTFGLNHKTFQIHKFFFRVMIVYLLRYFDVILY